ncbi:MAG: hypothetical protein ABJA02_01295, partial [Acidobacteriota bacterium]
MISVRAVHFTPVNYLEHIVSPQYELGQVAELNRNLIWALIVIGVLIHFSGAFNTIFSGDSALYAVISKSFATSSDFLNIYVD